MVLATGQKETLSSAKAEIKTEKEGFFFVFFGNICVQLFVTRAVTAACGPWCDGEDAGVPVACSISLKSNGYD